MHKEMQKGSRITSNRRGIIQRKRRGTLAILKNASEQSYKTGKFYNLYEKIVTLDVDWNYRSNQS